MAKKASGSTDKKAADKKGGKNNAKPDDAADKQGKVRMASPRAIMTHAQWLCSLIQGKSGALKSATSVNVRHILCEKQSKALEALQKIQVCTLSQ